MEQTASPCVSGALGAKPGQLTEPGQHRVSPQGEVLNGILMRALARSMKERSLNGPKVRELLRQPKSRDGELREQLGAIRRWDGAALTTKRVLRFCDALGVDAGLTIAAHYAAAPATAAPRVH